MVTPVLTGTEDPIVTGKESGLASYAGDYVTDMLGKGQALGNEAYNAYMGPLTAGASDLQTKAFEGVAGLANAFDPSQMGTAGYQPQQFTGDAVQQYMNPYLQASLEPQLEEARRQAGITAAQNARKFAGAYGGSAQALFDAESNRNLAQQLQGITGAGYADAYTQALNQFNTEQDRGMTAQDKINLYGTQGLQNLANMGATERAIESEGITADRLQFEEERDFPYKQVQYMQSLLQGLPIGAQTVQYEEPGLLQSMATGASDLEGFIESLFGTGGGTGGGGGQDNNPNKEGS
tara:strand:+ start:442 stop:1320 length:879 start_codon:yes stop_codon:yes gene_type:complete